MQSATTPDESEPSWKNPRFFIWLFVIGAIIYNSITYANVETLGYFFVYFMYYILVTLWYKYTQLNISLGILDGNQDNRAKIIHAINAFLILVIFGISFWVIFTMLGVIAFGILSFIVFAVIILYGVKLKLEQNDNVLLNLYKFTVSALFNFDYVALSMLFPIKLIYNVIANTNDAYNAKVKEAKSQTVNDKKIPSPLGEQIVYGSALLILMMTLVSYWWKFRTTVQLDKPINVSLDDSSSWKSLINIFPLDFLKAFPLIEYAKYVATNDLVELAKKVSIVGLLAYIGYLIIGVYIQKKSFIPCTESSFSSCFKTPFPISNDIPYVNLLFWTFVLCSVVNVANWIIGFIASNVAPQMLSSGSSAPGMIQLVQLLFFPFYWLITLVAQYPIASVIGFMLFAALGLILYRSSFDLNDFVQGQKGTVAALITMFIASFIVYGIYYMNSSTADMVQGNMSYGQFIGKTGLGIAVMICLIGLIMYFLNSHSKLVTVATIVQYCVNALIYITGIAFVIGLIRTLFSTSRKMGGSIFQVSRDLDSNWILNVFKLLANLLFYLPCLMLDFVEMVKEQYGLTTRPILLILAAEAAFILIGRYLPSLVAKTINHTGVQILSAPISMITPVPITTHDIQFVDAQGVDVIPTSPSSNMIKLKNYRYGISAWFYIHPQPPNTNENYSESFINIMKFGDFGPYIQYKPKTNTLQFGLYGKPIELTVSDVPLQTWNNFIINSDKGNVDIFINNKLVYTGNHIPDDKINAKDAIFNVELGQSDGIHGEICNIVLNTEPFTKPEIMWLYKTNKTLNPPVVGVDMDTQNQGNSENYLASESVNKNAPKPTPIPAISTSGAKMYGILGAVLGAIFGWLFNDETNMESAKGFIMGAIVFGLIGASLGALFSTDGTVAYILKTIANVFVDTF